MKSLFCTFLLAGFVFGSSLTAAAETPAALVGEYAGTWKNSEGAGGELRIVLRRDVAAAWSAEASFTTEGARVPTKMKSIRVDGSKVVMVFDWDVQGTAGQSKVSGELRDDTLQGTYETSGAAGESSGTWVAKRS